MEASMPRFYLSGRVVYADDEDDTIINEEFDARSQATSIVKASSILREMHEHHSHKIGYIRIIAELRVLTKVRDFHFNK